MLLKNCYVCVLKLTILFSQNKHCSNFLIMRKFRNFFFFVNKLFFFSCRNIEIPVLRNIRTLCFINKSVCFRQVDFFSLRIKLSGLFRITIFKFSRTLNEIKIFGWIKRQILFILKSFLIKN